MPKIEKKKTAIVINNPLSALFAYYYITNNKLKEYNIYYDLRLNMDNGINVFNLEFINKLFDKNVKVINKSKYYYRKGYLKLLKYIDIYKIIRINIILMTYNEIIISNIRFHKIILFKSRIKRIEHGLSDLTSKFDYEKISLIDVRQVKYKIEPISICSDNKIIEDNSSILLIDSFIYKSHYIEYYNYIIKYLSNKIKNQRLYIKTKSNINLEANLFDDLIYSNDVDYIDGRYPIEYLLVESNNIKIYSCLSSASVYSKIINPGVVSYSYHNHNLKYCSKHNLEPSKDLMNSIEFVYNQLDRQLRPIIL